MSVVIPTYILHILGFLGVCTVPALCFLCGNENRYASTFGGLQGSMITPRVMMTRNILTNNNQPKTHRRDGGGKGEEVQPGGSAGEVHKGIMATKMALRVSYSQRVALRV
jgi:hypothetical protein